MKDKKCGRSWLYIIMTAALLTGALNFSKGNAVWASQSESETVSANDLKRENTSESPELAQLQIPQKMEIIIDPWEMDEKEQIYSREYTVQNTGETPGTLILDFSCKIGKDTGLSFQENPDYIHHSTEKLICMKVLFGTGEEAVFTQEGVKYQIELQPGETLSLSFTGEVNENAEEPWKDGDIEIEGTYSWEAEAVQSGEVLDKAFKTDEAEKATVSENALPAKTGKDGNEGRIPSNEVVQDESGEEQVPPKEAEQESVKENSLSGNKLKEQEKDEE